MLKQYSGKNKAARMLELVMDAPSGETVIPMQFPAMTQPEEILEAAKRHIQDPYVNVIRVLDLTSSGDTWRVVKAFVKTITEEDY